MKNAIDIVYEKLREKINPPLEREKIAAVVTEVLLLTKEELKAGNEVYWPGLCTFTWKSLKRGKRIKVDPVDGTEKNLSARGLDLEPPEEKENV